MANNDKAPELTNKEFDSFIKKGLVLIDFFAEWCMPCVTMSIVIDEISDKFRGKIKVGKVNVEDSPALAQKFHVSSIPNLILFKDGKMIDQIIGALPVEELEDRLNEYLL